MTTVTMRMPEDVVEDLKRVAPARGFGGYQPLIRAYVGRGLRDDLARLAATPDLDAFIAALERQGVDEATIEAALGEARARPAPVPT